IESVVPRAVTINYPHPGIQPLIEPGAVALEIVDPRYLTVGTVAAPPDFSRACLHSITPLPTLVLRSVLSDSASARPRRAEERPQPAPLGRAGRATLRPQPRHRFRRSR